MIRQGHWTDVTVLPSGDFLQITTDGPTVRGFALGIQLWQIDAPEDLLFCRCAMAGGKPVSIHQGQSGQAWLVSPDAVRSLGICFGVQPVAIDDTYAYVVRDSRTYDRIRLDNGEFESLPSGAPGSSQGISDVEPDGTIRWADLWRVARVGGVTLTYPNWRGAVVVGQCDPPSIVAWNGALSTVIAGDGYEPHLAASEDRYAIVARTPQGAAYVECPPWPAFVTSLPHPPIPSPDPEPIPMESKRLPDDVHAIVVALYLANLDLAKSPNDDDRRALQKKICETVRARKGARWGWKSNHGIGIANAKDAIAELPAGAAFTPNQRQPLYMWDLFSGGTREPHPQPVMSEAHNYEQFFVPVEPVDHLASVYIPPAPPEEEPPVYIPPAPTPIDYGPRRLAAIEASILKLAEAIEKLRIPGPSVVAFPAYEGSVKFSGRVRLEPVK